MHQSIQKHYAITFLSNPQNICCTDPPSNRETTLLAQNPKNRTHPHVCVCEETHSRGRERGRQGELMDPVVLDRIIDKLIEVRSSKPGKLVQLSESEIKQLCAASREIFISQPNLLELEAPIKICGKFFCSL